MRIFAEKPVGTHARSGARPASVTAALRSDGKPIDAGTRQVMEQRFGHDFGSVRVHDDGQASQSARDVHAFAYTVGHHVVFDAEHYSHALLEHELTHVVQQRTGQAATGALQRAPNDPIELTFVRNSPAQSDLLFHDTGVKLPGSPPRVNFGKDGPIPADQEKTVQLALDLAYRTASSPTFATKLGGFKTTMGKAAEAQIPGLADLTQQKYLEALQRMTIHLADTSKNPVVVKFREEEKASGETLPVAGVTPIGGSDVYLRAFALKEGRDALASLILHESAHVAGLPAKPLNEFVMGMMEVGMHGFEADAGLPFSQIVEGAAAVDQVKAKGQGVEFRASVTKPDVAASSTIRVEVLDGNRKIVFAEDLPRKTFRRKFVWNGLDEAGKPTQSGFHSIRITGGAVLMAGHDYLLRRETK